MEHPPWLTPIWLASDSEMLLDLHPTHHSVAAFDLVIDEDDI